MNNRLEKLEAQFSSLAQEIYELGERRILPTAPWILIRTVPKEQKIGHIILSENAGSKEQNKTLHEGIVLATWKPFVQEYVAFESNGEKYYKSMQSEFELGDRVLYPHFAGLPVNFLDDRKYRLVREVTDDALGGVLCKVHYEGDNNYKEVSRIIF